MTQLTIEQALQIALAHHQAGRLPEAETLYRQILARQPDHPRTLYLLGTTLLLLARRDEAIVALRRAIELHPAFHEAYYNLGTALHDQGQLDPAIAAYRQAIQLHPAFPQAFYNLGNALHEQDQLDPAIAAYRQAIQLQPDFVEACNNLGNVLRNKRDFPAAIAVYRRAAQLNPNSAQVHYNLAAALHDATCIDEAIASFHRALELKPGDPDIHVDLGNAYKDQARIPEALACYDVAIASRPDLPAWHSNRLYLLHYDPACSPAQVFQEHLLWNRRHAHPLRPSILPHANDRSPNRPLKIGFVSPDLRQHSVAFFLLPLLQSLDRAQFHLTCYSNSSITDDVTARIKPCVDHWCNIKGLTDEQAAAQIRHDQIDILLDLAGHTAHNRLPLFARKPAPVQVTYLGYPGSTGLDTIDYRLSDSWADPLPGTPDHASEQIVRLPQAAWCFAPLFTSPPITDSPLIRHGYLTLGTFNNFTKINPSLLDLWSRILQQIPNSHLLLKNLAMNSHLVLRQLREFFAARNIAGDRLQFLPHQPSVTSHLQKYADMDIALDTFPYHGTTTTCEALWMGVPVITLAGQTHASRVGVSLLSNVGLPELIAHTPDDYVKITVELARDPSRLQQLRATLRDQMQRSPLMNPPLFARNVESAFRHMWQTWCAEVKP